MADHISGVKPQPDSRRVSAATPAAQARTERAIAPRSLGKLTKFADHFLETKCRETGVITGFERISRGPNSADIAAETYNPDNAELERWLLKSKARHLLMVIEERTKRTRAAYSVLAPYCDLKTREVVVSGLSFICESFKIYDAVVRESVDGQIISKPQLKKAPVYRVINCSRDKISSTVQPEIWQSKETKKASFHNLGVCGSVWTCPTCSRRINLARRDEIKTAYECFVTSKPKLDTGERDGDAVLVTFTIKHGIGDKLSDLFDRLKDADRRFMQKAYAYKKLVGFTRISGGRKLFVPSPLSYVGRISTSEITHGDNGWHPHLHQLWFFDRRLKDREIVFLRKELFSVWRDACKAAGLPQPRETYKDQNGVLKFVGVDARRALSAEEYMAKFGVERAWGPEAEMASQHTKSGRKGRTAFQLLYDAAQDDEHAGKLFKVFADATLGRHQLEFSKSLRKRLSDLGYSNILDRSDEELAATLEADSSLLGTLTDQDYQALLGAEDHGIEAFGTMLLMCKFNGFDQAVDWLRSLPSHPAPKRYSDDACSPTPIGALESDKRAHVLMNQGQLVFSEPMPSPASLVSLDDQLRAMNQALERENRNFERLRKADSRLRPSAHDLELVAALGSAE